MMRRAAALLLLLLPAWPALGDGQQDYLLTGVPAAYRQQFTFASDLSDYYYLVFTLDQATGTDRPSEANSICMRYYPAARCTMVEMGVNDTALNTSNFVQGAGSADLPGNAASLYCTDANCAWSMEANLSIFGFTTLAWRYTETDNDNNEAWDVEAGTSGWKVGRDATPDWAFFDIANAANTDIATSVTASTSWAIETWYNVGARWRPLLGEAEVVFDGVPTDPAYRADMANNGTENPKIFTRQQVDPTGIADLVVLNNYPMPDSFIAWTIACDPDGSACQCNGTSYQDDGRNTDYSLGLGSVLPRCDITEPPILTLTQAGETIALYDYEGESGSEWLEKTDGTCADCGLTAASGTPDQDTTSPASGFNWVNLDQSGTVEYLECDEGTDSSCGDLSSLLYGTVTFGTYADSDRDTNNEQLMQNLLNDGGGFRLGKGSTNNDVSCEIANGTTSPAATSSANSFEAADGTVGIDCVHDRFAETIETYLDTVLDGSATATGWMLPGGADFRIGQNTAGASFDGQEDLSYVFRSALSEPERCYTRSCGWRNRRMCAFYPPTMEWTDTGLQSTLGCSLAGIYPYNPIADFSPDQGNEMVSYYTLNDSTNPFNQSGGLCPNCDLTDTNTPTRSTASPPVNLAWLDLDSDDYLQCDDTDCAGYLEGAATRRTWGGYFYAETDANMNWIGRLPTNQGYMLSRNPTGDHLRCQIGDGSNSYIWDSTASDWPINTLVRADCVFDAVRGELWGYVNGLAAGSPITADGIAAMTTLDWRIGHTGSNQPEGQGGDMYVSELTLAPEESCYLASCTIENDSGCRGNIEILNAFEYTDVPGLDVWLDGSDLSTITESSGAVSEWRDKSGNGNDAAQATSNRQPAYLADCQNGRSCIDFEEDTNGDYMVISPGPAMDPSATDVVVVAAFAMESQAGDTNVIGQDDGGGTGRPWLYTDDSSANELATFLDGTENVASTGNDGTGIYVLGTMAYDDSAGTIDFYRNGKFDGQITSVSATANSGTPDLIIGNNKALGTGSHLDGTLLELLVFSQRPTDGQLDLIHAKMQQKWNLPEGVGFFTYAGRHSQLACSLNNVDPQDPIADFSPDIGHLFAAGYNFDSAGSPYEKAYGYCDDCGLTANNSPARLTSDPPNGSAGYLELSDATSDYLECDEATDSTCTIFGFTGDLSVSHWTRRGNDAHNVAITDKSLGNGGFETRIGATLDGVLVRVGDGTNTTEHQGDSDTLDVVDGWAHVVGFYDDTAQIIDDYINGIASTASATSHTTGMVAGTRDMRIGGSSTDGDVELDNVSYYEGVLTEAQACYLGSCGEGNESLCRGWSDGLGGGTFAYDGLRSTLGCSLDGIDPQNPLGVSWSDIPVPYSHVKAGVHYVDYSPATGESVKLHDLSGNDHAFRNFISHDGPTFLEDCGDGMPCLDFDPTGQDDNTKSPDEDGIDPSTDSVTVMAVFEFDAAVDGVAAALVGQADGGGTGRTWFWKPADDVLTMNMDGSNHSCTTVMDPDTWYIGTLVYDAAADTIDCFLNGVFDDQDTSVSGTANSGDPAIWIGDDTNAWDGQVREVAIWDAALSDQERATAEWLMMKEWGLLP